MSFLILHLAWSISCFSGCSKKGWLCDGEELAPKNFLGNLKKVKELLLQKQVNFHLQHTERDRKIDVDN